jgi:hypothetical protein
MGDIHSTVIKPNIKCGEEVYPSTFNGFPPLALKDLTVTGEYHDFRYMVWRSLAKYLAANELSYEYMDAYRLVEIFLGKDTLYDRVRDLESLQLLVLVLGVSDLPNRMLPALVCQILTLRKMSGLPTWTFVTRAGSQLRTAYSNEMADLLGVISPSVYDTVNRPNRIGGSGTTIIDA